MSIIQFFDQNYGASTPPPVIPPGTIIFRAGNQQSFGTVLTGQQIDVATDTTKMLDNVPASGAYIDLLNGHTPPSNDYAYVSGMYPTVNYKLGYFFQVQHTALTTYNYDTRREFRLSQITPSFGGGPGIIHNINFSGSGGSPFGGSSYSSGAFSAIGNIISGNTYQFTDSGASPPIFRLTNNGPTLNSVVITYAIIIFAA